MTPYITYLTRYLEILSKFHKEGRDIMEAVESLYSFS